jgi:hypothetical protein
MRLGAKAWECSTRGCPCQGSVGDPSARRTRHVVHMAIEELRRGGLLSSLHMRQLGTLVPL